MTNGQIYETIVALLRKEARGNIIKPERFTSLLQLCHWEMYNMEVQKWKQAPESVDSLRPFIVTDEAISATSGKYALSGLTAVGSGAGSESGAFQHAIGVKTAVGKYTCDIATPAQWSNWEDDPLMRGVETNPLVMFDNQYMHIAPSTVQNVLLTYLKKPDSDPYFDYYIDANRNIQYLSEGQADYTLQTNEIYRDGTTSGAVESQSVELDWDEPEKATIVNMILGKLGITLSEPSLVKYSTDRQEQTN